MFQKLAVLAVSLVICCSAFALPPVFHADTPYFYNPEGGYTSIDFNGGGLFDFDCGVSYTSSSAGYSLRLPLDMDRVYMIPYRYDVQGIETICDGSFEGGPDTSITMSVPVDMTGLPFSDIHEYMFVHDGPAYLTKDGIFGISDIVAIATAVPKPITGFESDISAISPSDHMYPTTSPKNNLILIPSEGAWKCYPLIVTFQNFTLDICIFETPPVAWDAVAAHAASEFTYAAGMPSVFIADFERYEDRMMAVYNNFWVQNNDPSVLFFTAQQNRLWFTRLSYDLLMEDLVTTYTTWYNALP